MMQNMGLNGFSLCLILSFALLEVSRGQYFGIYLDKRAISADSGYGSRIQAGTNLVNGLDILRSVYGQYGPGKRAALPPLVVYTIGSEIAKRTDTDFGYGSRLSAGENIAQSWDRSGLFGLKGPGKRSNAYTLSEYGLNKRIATDFGYGSRSQAAENAAYYHSRGELFGIRGPGKRNVGLVYLGRGSDDDISKRQTSDYGYGSRVNAGENIALAASNHGLYGVYGPGKRNIEIVNIGKSTETGPSKRKTSDYGYGSRVNAGENVARVSSYRGLYGGYGAGKRTD